MQHTPHHHHHHTNDNQACKTVTLKRRVYWLLSFGFCKSPDECVQCTTAHTYAIVYKCSCAPRALILCILYVFFLFVLLRIIVPRAPNQFMYIHTVSHLLLDITYILYMYPNIQYINTNIQIYRYFR